MTSDITLAECSEPDSAATFKGIIYGVALGSVLWVLVIAGVVVGRSTGWW